MLGPLKFGLQKPVPTVKAAPLTPMAAVVAPARFALTLSLEGSTMERIMLSGPKGATAYVDWGDGTNSSIGFTGAIYTINNHSCGSTATFSGSNLITFIDLLQNGNRKIKGITGTYPTSLLEFVVSFNYADPVFTPPNVARLEFYGSSGPYRLTTGTNLLHLNGLPSTLTSLDTSKSAKLTRLPTLPAGLEYLTTPPGITGLTGLPGTLTYLDLAPSTKLTSLPTLPAGLTSLYTPPGIIGLTGLPGTLTYLDLEASTKLTSLPALPAGLTNLYTPPGITGLTGLPGTLTVLGTSKSTKLTRLPTLPAGLTSLYTPPGITGLPSLPGTLTRLYLGASTKLTSLPPLAGLTILGTPPGITGLPTLPGTLTELNTFYSTKLTSLSILGNTKLKYISLSPACKSLDVSGCTGLENIKVEFISPLTTLDISNCTALTSIPTLPALTTLRIDGSGLTSLDLTKTSVTTLNVPPSMNSQLRTLKVAGSKLKLSGLLDYSIPQGANWTLY